MLNKKIYYQDIFPFLSMILSLVFFFCTYYEIIVLKNINDFFIPVTLTVVLSMYIFIKNKNIISLGSSMFIYFYSMVTLLGVIISFPLFPELVNLRSDLYMDFLNYPELNKAVSLSCIGINTFVILTDIFSNVLRNKNYKKTKIIGGGLASFSTKSTKKTKVLGNTALLLQLFCLLYFLLFFLSSGYGSAYADIHSQASSNGVYGHMLIVMVLSITTIFTVGTKKQMKLGILIFIFLAFIHLSFGNRGEIYYPLLAILAIYHKRGGTFKLRTVLVGLFGSLLLISSIRLIRVDGNFSTLLDTFSPIKAVGESIGEMGLQISTVTYLLSYLNMGGKYQLGYSVVYSFQNFFSKYLSFLPNVDPLSPAAIRTVMPIDNVGFTNLGEAYFNFGLAGVILFYAVLSFYFVFADFKEQNVYFKIFNGMFLVWVLTWVRNSSSSMPSYMAWMILLLMIYYTVDKISSRLVIH